jgi:TldD protein
VSLDLLTELMAKAAGRCAYAEARHVDRRDEALAVRAGEVDEFAASTADGIGVRVRIGGGWGLRPRARSPWPAPKPR